MVWDAREGVGKGGSGGRGCARCRCLPLRGIRADIKTRADAAIVFLTLRDDFFKFHWYRHLKSLELGLGWKI